MGDGLLVLRLLHLLDLLLLLEVPHELDLLLGEHVLGRGGVCGAGRVSRQLIPAQQLLSYVLVKWPNQNIVDHAALLLAAIDRGSVDQLLVLLSSEHLTFCTGLSLLLYLGNFYAKILWRQKETLQRLHVLEFVLGGSILGSCFLCQSQRTCCGICRTLLRRQL